MKGELTIIVIFLAEVYFHGIQASLGLIGSVLGYLICAVILVPTFYNLKLVSVYEVILKIYYS